MRARTIVVTLVAGLGLAAGCGSSSPAASSNGQGAASTTTAAPSPSTTAGSGPTTTAGGAGIEWSAAGSLGSKPTIVVPSGSPPSTLETHDLIVGTGKTAGPGQTVTVQYVGVSWTTKQEFDSSWSRGQAATFTLGQVIEGWNQGVPGMKVGGRRELIIPPSLAYGASPPPGSGIPANDTLIFIVDLVSVG